MKYQCSLEGHVHGRHAQLDFYNTVTFADAIKEIRTRKHLLYNKNEEWIALLFNNREQAIKDGVPEKEIEATRSNNTLFMWKAKIF